MPNSEPISSLRQREMPNGEMRRAHADLTIPNKLYGREQDIITLLESFERVSSGHGVVLLVSGSSGAGKTALVQELQRPVRERNGFFTSGKFDQFQQNIPYFAFRQALAELCRQLQAEDARRRSRFKADILEALGDLGQVLVDMVPEFESFLGVQPELGVISPQEARHRLAEVLQGFLKVICRPEHPLALFIDDWQWADAASLNLLKKMQIGITLRYLLVIVSYRDNEVNSAHPLISTVDDLRSRAVPIQVLHANNLTVDDVRAFLSDTLKPAAEDIEGLAAMVHGKTQGNPFFVRSLLRFLDESHRIWLNRARNCWQWRNKMGGEDLPGDVVKLFVWKLQRLNADIQALFSLAACIGNRFDTETLSVISGRDPGECLALLFSDQAIDMLLPLAGGGGSSLSGYLHVPEAYTFIHDSLQQAAYSLIEPAALVSIHLKIGRLLLSILQPERLDERLFEVVNNLNAGFDLIQDNSEQVKVVELNVLAARKAFAGTAYSSALHYYRTAARFLEKPGFAEHLWRDYHELTLSLFVERTQCEFIEGNHNEAEKCIQQAEAHATSALETADVLKILIVQYTLMARYAQAISVGERALAALGIYLPGDRYEEIRDEEIAQIRQLLEDRSVASLGDLPVMSNSKMLMAAKILIAMGPPCYRSHQRLWSVIVPKVVNLTLHHGNIPQVGYSHTAFGGLLGWVDNDYATAKEFGELAERLMTSTFRSPVDQSVFYLMIGSSIRHWFKHLRHGTRDYEEAYEIGLRSGNLQYAAYAFGHNMYCRFYQGVPLSSLMQESLRCLEFSRTRLNQWAVDLLEGGLNVFGTLSGECPESNRHNAWSEVEYVRRVENHHNIQVACIYKVLKTLSLLVLGHCDHALVLSDETQPLIYTVGTQGLLPWPEHVFARLLILTSLYSKADEKRQTLWRVELDLLIRRLRLWADNCPENFEHKYLLSAAELARIDGRSLEAMPFYDKAIESARAGNFLQWEGMANERAHSFWMECGNERLAQVYWQQAYDCYNRWGAGAKVDAMETEFRMFIDKNIPVGGGDRRPAENLERQTSYALAERQIHQLRNYAVRMHQFELQVEAVTHAEELAHAMQRLGVEIAERGRAESALRESEDRFKSAFQHSPIGMALISPEGKWLMVNASACSIVGYSEAELLTMTFQDITHPADLDIDLNYVRQMLSGEIATYAMEKRYYHKEGFIIWVLLSVTMIRDKDGVPLYFISQIEDITKRKRAEDAVRESLREKESLLKEIHHRVKNNLQIVSSLLRLQSGQIDHSIAKAALKDMQNRVQSMALIHEHLYRSENLAQVDIAAYLQSLCPKLMRTLAARPDAIQLHMDLIPVYLDIDQAIPCGLLVNELISNALKHAFPSGRTGEVRLELRPVDDGRQIHLRVSDNGVGLPADFDMQRLSSLGLELASDLATQIRGRLEIGPGPGATFDVLFTLGNRMDSPRKPGDTETRRKENE